MPAIAVLLMLISAVACADADPARLDSSRDRSSGSARPSIEPSPDARTIDIGHGGAIDVEVGEEGVWVTTPDGILEIDPTTNEIVNDVPWEGAFDVDVGDGDGDGDVWITDTYGPEVGELVRIDTATGDLTASIGLGPVTPYCVAATNSAVWVTGSGDEGGDVIRIDPATNDVVARIHIEPGAGTGGIGCVAADEESVWITRGGKDDSLVRIDPRTNEISAVVDIPNPDYWNDIVIEAGSLWVATGPRVTLDDGTRTSEVRVLQVDPLTGEVSEPIMVGHGMFGIGAGEGAVWVFDGFHLDSITQIDAASETIVRRVPIPDGGSGWGGGPGIAAANGIVWMAGTTALIRVDLEVAAEPAVTVRGEAVVPGVVARAGRTL